MTLLIVVCAVTFLALTAVAWVWDRADQAYWNAQRFIRDELDEGQEQDW